MSVEPRQRYDLPTVRERAGLGPESSIGNILHKCVAVDDIILEDLGAIKVELERVAILIDAVLRDLSAEMPSRRKLAIERLITAGRCGCVAAALFTGVLVGAALAQRGCVAPAAGVPTFPSWRAAPATESDPGVDLEGNMHRGRP